MHIGNGAEETKIADLAELVVGEIGSGGAREPRPAPVGSVVRRCPDVRLLEQANGFGPKVDLAEGVPAAAGVVPKGVRSACPALNVKTRLRRRGAGGHFGG